MYLFFPTEVSLDKRQFVGWKRAGITLEAYAYDQYREGYFPETITISARIIFKEIDARQLIDQFGHFEVLSSQLASLQVSPEASSDITLVTTADKRQFPVHTAILSARSTVFAAMFGNDQFKENQEHAVKIDDISGEVMEALLKYVYNGDAQDVGPNADALLQAADKVTSR